LARPGALGLRRTALDAGALAAARAPAAGPARRGALGLRDRARTHRRTHAGRARAAARRARGHPGLDGLHAVRAAPLHRAVALALAVRPARNVPARTRHYAAPRRTGAAAGLQPAHARPGAAVAR